MNPGRATSADFQRLQKACDVQVPDALKVILSESNGGLWFMDKEGLSADSIIDAICKMGSSEYWKSDMIPFALDATCTDGYLVVANSGKVYEWNSEEGLGDDFLSPTLEHFLENFRNCLLSGSCEYVDELGVIEKVASGASRK